MLAGASSGEAARLALAAAMLDPRRLLLLDDPAIDRDPRLRAAIAPGTLVDGPAIFEADLGYEIDNMEGIDCHTAENGDIVLTLVSDDNFSMIQRTLLLQFTLVEE